jgi:hypothetical protein
MTQYRTRETIEQKILTMITDKKSCTPFLIKKEFVTRQQKEVINTINKLLEAGRIIYDSDHLFLKINPEKSANNNG